MTLMKAILSSFVAAALAVSMIGCQTTKPKSNCPCKAQCAQMCKKCPQTNCPMAKSSKPAQ